MNRDYDKALLLAAEMGKTHRKGVLAAIARARRSRPGELLPAELELAMKRAQLPAREAGYLRAIAKALTPPLRPGSLEVVEGRVRKAAQALAKLPGASPLSIGIANIAQDSFGTARRALASRGGKGKPSSAGAGPVVMSILSDYIFADVVAADIRGAVFAMDFGSRFNLSLFQTAGLMAQEALQHSSARLEYWENVVIA